MSDHMLNAMKLQRLRYLIQGGMDPAATIGARPLSWTTARFVLFQRLGITYKGGKIPTEMEGTYELDGFTFKLYRGTSKRPIKEPTPAELKSKKFASRAHRLYVVCPACLGGRLFPVGRIVQHAQVHTTMIHATQAQLRNP